MRREHDSTWPSRHTIVGICTNWTLHSSFCLTVLDTLNSKPEAGSRKPETGNREIYGLGPTWLLRHGKVFAEAVVLSHEEQLNQLAGTTPEMVDRAVVAGDPCFDRMRASTHARAAYRRVLGASEGETVVVVSSTWGPNSLFGQHPDLLTELTAELTLDDHVPVAVLHPNLWFAHGPLQVRYWLGEALRSGLRLVPPFRGWQQAVLAADVVIGDHGAVTGYAAACGVPVLLAAFPKGDVAPTSAIDALGRTVPRIDHHEPLQPQIRRAIENHDNTLNAEVAELASSVPDQAADLLRSLFYRIIGLSEPDRSPLLVPYAAAELRPEQRPVQAMWVSGELLADNVVRLVRWPSDVSARRGRGPRAVETHLVVDSVHPRRDLRGNAAIVVLTAPGHDLDAELARILRERPASELAVALDASGQCRLRHRGGGLATAQPGTRDDPATIASAIHVWLTHRGPWQSLPPTLNVQLGRHTFAIGIRLD